METYTKVFIFISVIVFLALLSYIAYINLRTIIKQEDFSRILKCCLAALGSELKTKLVISDTNTFNSFLAEYLCKNELKAFKKLISALSLEVKKNKDKELTQPGLIMKNLIILVAQEQLKIKYKDGFMFDQSKFDNLEKECPFVYHYCVIVKLPEGYFTDILVGKIFHNFQDTLQSSFDKIMIKVQKEEHSDLSSIIMPQKIISVYQSLDQEYLLELSNYSRLKVALFDGKAYSVCAFMIRNGSNSNYKVKGGDKLTSKDSLKLKNKFRNKDKSFLSVSVLSKSQSY